ncbi:MAG: glycoside hydrolase family 9 protein [Prevotella sp.]|nr:glycoside hydrolase family 9 protein [Prevotella sp.]
MMAQQQETIRMNQVALYPSQQKTAVVEAVSAKKISVTDVASGKRVGKPRAVRTSTSPWSGKKRTVIDVANITAPGTYELSVNGETQLFEVKSNALTDITKTTLKAFYLIRSGVEIEAQYAKEFARPLGHPDTQVMVHASAVSPGRPEGTIISSPLGWYDAGDYNKYIVNSAYSVGVMLQSYEQNKAYFDRLDVNIPESKNQTADLLDEVMFNLKWMLTMQDPYDGGVYHKLTTPNFEGFVMPKDCHQQRYVIQKSVTATYDFAAVMALASRLFEGNKDYSCFSARAKDAALAAYNWAELHPKALYNQFALNKEFDPDVNTGTYGDMDASDERLWAATELYLLTGDKVFLDAAQPIAERDFMLPTWGNVTGLAMFTWIANGLSPRASSPDTQQIGENLKGKLLAYSDKLLATTPTSSFDTPSGNDPQGFGWGCLAENFCANGMTLLYAHKITGDKKYLEGALQNSDYILGRNATGYCYVTGFGQKSTMNPHHRISAADGITAPMPGLLAGGPNPGQQDNMSGSLNYPSKQPDESYIDHADSYASNEIAINWNATLVAMLGWIDAEMK